MSGDERVERILHDVEGELTLLRDETPSLAYRSLQIQVEILRELRTQRGITPNVITVAVDEHGRPQSDVHAHNLDVN